MKKCFFCGEREGCVLETHHVIPRKIQEKYHIYDDYTITLCANCHRKIHFILNYIFSKLKIIDSKEDTYDDSYRCPQPFKDILNCIGDGIEKSKLISILVKKGYSADTIVQAIEKMKCEGTIYMPKPDFYKIEPDFREIFEKHCKIKNHLFEKYK